MTLSFLMWFVITSTLGSAAPCERREAPKFSESLADSEFDQLIKPLWLHDVGFASPLALIESLTLRCPIERQSPPAFRKLADSVMNLCRLDASDPVPARAPGSVEIQVYFHILTATNGAGTVPESAVLKQIEVLNDAFAGKELGGSGVATPFTFALESIDCTINDEWFNMKSGDTASQAERDAKSVLHQGDKAALNIYTAKVDGPYGWARYPWDLADEVDGVVVRYSTLPGGITAFYDEGDVTAHEVGHWLGLFHTFENECNAPGDCVEDTAFEKYHGRFCRGDDSCPASSGRDPITNFMDCTWDKCACEFTRGQVERMDAIHFKYRM